MRKFISLFTVLSICALLCASASAVENTDFPEIQVDVEYEYHDKVPGEEYPAFISDTTIPNTLMDEMAVADPSAAVSYDMETNRTVLHDVIKNNGNSQGTIGSDDSVVSILNNDDGGATRE